MNKNLLTLLLLLVCGEVSAQVVKSLALDRLADLDKIVAMDSKILTEMRGANSNPTLLVRDQNIRYMALIEKSTSTFGDDPLGPHGSCVKALASAHILWQSKVDYEKSRSNFDQESLLRWRKISLSDYKECRSYVNNLH